MTEHQIAVVQESFALLRPEAGRVAATFYERLFELDPELRWLFKGPIEEQGGKLMMMLATVVAGLTHLERVVPAIRGLGARHVEYGVTAAHYGTVGQALLWTLERCLGEEYTPEVEESWTAAYALLSGTMKETAYGATA